jgi:hypothetical protein
MTHISQIGPVHNAALRKEISERLGLSLDRRPAGMPPHLAMLVKRWREESEQPRSEATDRPGRSK